MKRVLSIVCAIAASFVTASCIFDFETDIAGAGYLVIEGDIIPKGLTEVTVSMTESLKYVGEQKVFRAERVYVETESGKVFEGSSNNDNTYDVNTKDLPLDERCRLVVKYGDEYVSDWLTPLVTPQIDSLSYAVEGNRLNVRVTTHSSDGNCYYMWNAHELWEYHSELWAYYYYNPGFTYRDDKVLPFENGVNTYYCWDEDDVTDLMTFSTESMSENRIVNLNLFSKGKHDKKISYIYSVDVAQKSISKEAYLYFQNIEKNSDDVGGLFSPQPSEMRGNITNLQHPDEMVLGFVSAVVPSSERLFIYNSDTRFYVSETRSEDIEKILADHSMWRSLYQSGYFVYNVEDNQMQTYPVSPTGSKYEWVERRCVDCTFFGGTKNKPEWWPNQDK